MYFPKKFFLWLGLIILGTLGYVAYKFYAGRGGGDNGPKQEAVKLKTHSDTFNMKVTTLLSDYFAMHDAFVDADTTKAKAACKSMIAKADSFDLSELKKDTSGIYQTAYDNLENVKLNAKSLLAQTNIAEMRKDYSGVNENLFPFLRVVNYKGTNTYWQNCPMAFGEGKEANWISNTREIVNPYLGKNDPEFKGSMLHCGEVKDSLVSPK